MNKIESKHFPFIYGENYMQKYNRELHKYEEYKIPKEWRCPLYSEDMDEVVNCAQCGKEVLYGDCYTSMEVHNHIGLGYGVCPDCYKDEHNRRFGEPIDLR